MIKKILCICLAVFCAGNADASVSEPPEKTLHAGDFSVRCLDYGDTAVYLFSQIIYPGRKRTLNVAAMLGRSGVVSRNLYSQHPAHKEAIELVFNGFVKAWEDWRTAANPYLPKAYQLPQVSFKLMHWVDSIGDKPGVYRLPAPADIQLFLNPFGIYRNGSWELGSAAFYKKTGLFYFNMHEAWMAYLNQAKTGRPSEETVKAYESAVCDYISNSRSMRHLEKLKFDIPASCAKELAQIPPSEWHKKGAWGEYVQGIITHEMGHLFGLAHESDHSIMEPYADAFDLPTKADGLRLATLACWYHNQRAGREVCVPVKAPASAEAVRALQKRLGASPMPAPPLKEYLKEQMDSSARAVPSAPKGLAVKK